MSEAVAILDNDLSTLEKELDRVQKKLKVLSVAKGEITAAISREKEKAPAQSQSFEGSTVQEIRQKTAVALQRIKEDSAYDIRRTRAEAAARVSAAKLQAALLRQDLAELRQREQARAAAANMTAKARELVKDARDDAARVVAEAKAASLAATAPIDASVAQATKERDLQRQEPYADKEAAQRLAAGQVACAQPPCTRPAAPVVTACVQPPCTPPSSLQTVISTQLHQVNTAAEVLLKNHQVTVPASLTTVTTTPTGGTLATSAGALAHRASSLKHDEVASVPVAAKAAGAPIASKAALDTPVPKQQQPLQQEAAAQTPPHAQPSESQTIQAAEQVAAELQQQGPLSISPM